MKPIGLKSTEENIEKVSETVLEVTEKDMLFEKIKAHLEAKNIHLTKDKQNDWDSKETVKGSKAKADKVMALLHAHTANNRVHVTDVEKEIYKDKYTKNEIDNKFAAYTSNINWKETVNTIEEFVLKYLHNPSTQEGDYVIVNNDAMAYRFTNGKWMPMKTSIYPLATSNTDGLMSKNDYNKLSTVQEFANNYEHPDNSEMRHVSDIQIDYWNNKADNSLADYYSPGLLRPTDQLKLDSISIDGPIVVSRDISYPIVKDKTNTVTIGPETSNADYVCGKNESISSVLYKAISNGASKIVILSNKNDYILDKTVNINVSDICITGEYGVTINNIIDDSNESRCAFVLNGSNNTISNLTIKATSPDGIVIGMYAIKCIGNNNTIDSVSVLYGNGIILDGSTNSVVTNCNLSSNTIGVGIYSNKEHSSQSNRVSNNNFTKCKTGIDIYTFKNENKFNILSDNIIIDSFIGINMYNLSKTFTNVPTDNIVKFNIICRGTGLPTDYENDQYTIISKASDTIFIGNITKGKDIVF